MFPILDFSTLNLGLDGVLEHWLNNTRLSLSIVGLWLHAFDGLEFSSMAARSCKELPDTGMDKTNLLLDSMAIRLCVAKCLITIRI